MPDTRPYQLKVDQVKKGDLIITIPMVSEFGYRVIGVFDHYEEGHGSSGSVLPVSLSDNRGQHKGYIHWKKNSAVWVSKEGSTRGGFEHAKIPFRYYDRKTIHNDLTLELRVAFGLVKEHKSWELILSDDFLPDPVDPPALRT